jgi:nitrate reductase cytochrome c-type subunit
MKHPKTLSILTIIAGLFLLKSCTNSNSNKNTVSEGETLLAANCYSCHSPTAGMDSRLAPPMIAVKNHYSKKYSTKDEFITAMISFIKNPTKEKSLMKGAIKKFGLMSQMNFEEEKLKKIVTYIYENEMQKPEWFDEHHKEKHQKKSKNKEEESPLKKGQAMALKTKSALGKNLMKAINEGGAAHAIDFCNIQAMPITDSLAQLQNALIKRVSDKNRNPNNAANAEELKYIEKVKSQIANEEEYKGEVSLVDGKWVGYYPIITNAMCLQCHGEIDKDIKPATLAKIEEKYPNDLAKGYGVNELRGIWVVEFPQ